MYKLRIHAKNAVFGLRLQVSVGESLIIGTAEATAVCLACLPLTTALRIRRNLEVRVHRCFIRADSYVISTSLVRRRSLEGRAHQCLISVLR